ncbi:hypothetical protein [Verrucomicrobium spinosum]|uniref:hypothetical protein n=1 Tax=Verrucomicrobium spinosum TaxID=2736 RepID=UPI000A8BDDC9|nr:hypothetical protein [Verrucomicrobium spinosum]
MRSARRQAELPGGVTAKAWLENYNDLAVQGVLTGDMLCTALSTPEGGSSSHLRGMTSAELVVLTDMALKALAAEEATGGAEQPPAEQVTYLTHGCRPAMW